MKTFKEQAIELINKKDFNFLFQSFKNICFGGDPNNVVREIMQLIVENSNDFTKDIAQKWIDQYEKCPGEIYANDGSPARYISRLSDKQLWCLVYQIKNNFNVYAN